MGDRGSRNYNTTTGSESGKVANHEGTEKRLQHQILEQRMIGSSSTALARIEGASEGETGAPKDKRTDNPSVKTDMEVIRLSTTLESTSENLNLRDNMLIDLQQHTEHKSGHNNKHLVDTEQHELEKGKLFVRRPLQDCTNRVQLKLGEEKVDLPLKTKGQ